MYKKIYCLILVIICFVFASCGSQNISSDEVQNIRDMLAGDWKLTDEYLDNFDESELSKDFTITILADGTWFFFEDDDSYVSDLCEYYVDYAYDGKYAVDFVFSNTSDTLSCIYYDKTDSLFQTEETAFTIKMYDVLERL